MNVTFVENAEDDVDDDDRGQNQEGFARERRAEFRRRAGECCRDRVWQTNFLFRFLNGGNRVAERAARLEIE